MDETPTADVPALVGCPRPGEAVCGRVGAGWPLVVAAAFALGCGAASGSAGGAGPGGASSSGGAGPGGGASSSGGAGSSGGGSTVCRIATLGYAGQWGDGNVFTDWLTTKSAQGTTALEGAVLTADLLAPFQVIVAQDVRVGSPGQAGIGQGIGRAYSAAEAAALERWVTNGGGLMTLMGYGDASEITNVNALLAPYGLSYGSNQVLFGAGSATTPVTQWASHPIANGVTRVGVNNGYPVQGGGTLVAWEPTPGQYDVGRALDLGRGHVFAWADEWITYNSEWTPHPDYQVARFWANALTWLSQSYGCTVPIPPGTEW